MIIRSSLVDIAESFFKGLYLKMVDFEKFSIKETFNNAI